MECNKDEAFRAKAIAEKKLIRGDIKGAKKFASKAQRMFPKLDGLSQFLAIIDVYVAHENKINGHSDYYGIFGLDRFADEQTLKKQYKRMALSLHPDKNRAVGADGAFKIMSEAWCVLSDKGKRSAYNSKLEIKASKQTTYTVKTQSVRRTQRQTQGTGTNAQSTTARDGEGKKPKSETSSEGSFWSWRRVVKYKELSLSLFLFASLLTFCISSNPGKKIMAQ
ncbi:hypothetical protein ABFS82_09G066800 [Erythranthe guttata]|uniref:J domain-containing protein n=1 Tax=Erythranthe guttata TaxID=4155 RepID=A0A022Q766_ERYGU|nr:PREDICTED: dnaJ homolog subfamily B member 14-like [Erythranthe guttata]XP_012854522.1 PREDICTED: dnaJ homolog subfamily B member 14-like [Erythranthe guttata]EYU23088.1 hypothetical protein MIMGU_mgv11b011132mg [Erythranthe guttata]|eukprot:XP_012854520.1 PREDICTED: dnaJ homolog subfamily B member 14-like [Erythranthe guttata]